MLKRPPYILPLIIFSQFAGTSIWFAGNAILPDLITEYGFVNDHLASITSAVQFGFIIGTLIFALLTLSDRFHPSKVFFFCAVLGAISNFLMIHFASSVIALHSLRFITGLSLAGIYPVGMKIASDWYQGGLGKALGLLVGALVLGTAFPHLVKSLGTTFNWELGIMTVSMLAVCGGSLILIFVKSGPFRKPLEAFQLKAIFAPFGNKKFRLASFGYFGHMWELYTFWAFVPFILVFYQSLHAQEINIPLWSFMIIANGALGCAVGGSIALKKGSGTVAFYHLLFSGMCILLFPFAIHLPLIPFLIYLLIWGWSVVADSPQFSTLSARHAPQNLVGTGLTIMSSIGFALTIVSIFVVKETLTFTTMNYAILWLLPGPVFGLFSIFELKDH